METIGYSCPIRLVPTYILPAIELRPLGRFHTDSFYSERLACMVRLDMARSTRLVTLIKNIYTFWVGNVSVYLVHTF